MNDIPVNPKNEKAIPTCRVCVSKEDAASMKVGSDIKIEVSGQVKSLQPSYDDKEMYDVEIENPSYEVESASEDADENEGDENMATMPRAKLKKKIMTSDNEY